MFVTDTIKDTCILQNVSVSRKLRGCNVLQSCPDARCCYKIFKFFHHKFCCVVAIVNVKRVKIALMLCCGECYWKVLL